MRNARYVLTAAARLDLLQLWNDLAQRASLDVADRVLTDIETGIEELVGTPGKGHLRPDLTRHPLLFYRVHSFLIIYRRDVSPIHVVRVLHAARDVAYLLKN